MKESIEVREVAWEQAHSELTGVRRAVFVEEQGVPAELEVDAHDPAGIHFLATGAAGVPVGTARLLPTGRIGRVAVLREFRGRGVGRALVEAAIRRWWQTGTTSIHLHAQSPTVPFYESLGFVAEGPEFEEAGIPHRVMRLVAGRDPRLRPARMADVPALEGLIVVSVRTLQASTYSREQREAALGPVFGVDQALIEDGTYLVIEAEGCLLAAGGWSRRRTLFGGGDSPVRDASLLDPATEAARIRAFFVRPGFERRGLASRLLEACEKGLREHGFRRAALAATLAGVPFYQRQGYLELSREDLALEAGLVLPVVKMEKDF